MCRRGWLRLGIMRRHGQVASIRRHRTVRVWQLREVLRRSCRARSPRLLVIHGRIVTVSRSRTPRGSSIVRWRWLAFRVMCVLILARSPGSAVCRAWWRRNGELRILGRVCRVGTRSWRLPVLLVVTRPLNGVLRHLDNLASLALILASTLRKGGVNRGQRRKHGLVQGCLVGMNRSGMLSQIIQTGESLSAVARERTLASVFSAVRRTEHTARTSSLTGHASPSARSG